MSNIMNPGRRDTSLLTTIAKGVAIARDIYGMKVDSDKLDMMKQDEDLKQQQQQMDLEERENAKKGILSKNDRLKAAQAGFEEVPAGTKGAFQFTSADSGEPVFLRKPQAVEKPIIVPEGSTVLSSGKPVFTAPKKDKDPKDPDLQVRADTSQLRHDYDHHDTTKRTTALLDMYSNMKGASSNPSPSPATDMRMIYAYMKLNDPTSSVREGEYASAENARGVSDSVRNIYNKILEGGKLTPEQRTQFMHEADGMMSAQLDNQAEVDQRFSNLATRYKTKAEDVLDPRFSALRKTFGDSQKVSLRSPGKSWQATGNGITPSAKPGETVEIRGKRFRVLSDGNSLEEITATGAN